ncbi:protein DETOXIFICATION 10-like [Carica papaya]|uniref:protein DETOXIFICATION 10-like n=1 Tax=Carica papaya TaxID=3649 RepID=UPI000B8CACDB|nr:protein DETOXIFICATION 10-like [Carica papaya]
MENEAPLLLPGNRRKTPLLPWVALMEELKRVSFMSAPMVLISVFQYLLQIISVVMAGRLGELAFSGISIANSFSNVTGFCILLGMSGALETLCGQAYGARQYHKLGNFFYSAVIIFFFIGILVSVLWIFSGKLLILLGEETSISLEASKYCIFLIPSIFSYAIFQSLLRYFLSQNFIAPPLITTSAVLCLYIPLCWILIYKLELGIGGGALAYGLAFWLNLALLGTYMKFSSSCERSRKLVKKDVLMSIKDFVRLGIPSALMSSLEWWSPDLLVLLSGHLPNPELETSALSICVTTISLHYLVSTAFGFAASIRVSNELGAGNERAAQVAVGAIMTLAVTESVIVSIVLFFFRHNLGYAYTNNAEVVNLVAELCPITCLCIAVQGILVILSGVTRGCGLQHLGAYINFGAYYLVGIPLAGLLGFVLHFGVKGLLIGLFAGAAVESFLLALVTALTNWHEQARKAQERALEGTLL